MNENELIKSIEKLRTENQAFYELWREDSWRSWKAQDDFLLSLRMKIEKGQDEMCEALHEQKTKYGERPVLEA